MDRKRRLQLVDAALQLDDDLNEAIDDLRAVQEADALKKHLFKFLPTQPNTLTTVQTMLTNVQNALRSKKRPFRPTAELLPTNFYSEEIRTCRELLTTVLNISKQS